MNFLSNAKERIFFAIFLLGIFILRISFDYWKFSKLKKPVFFTTAEVLLQYPKNNYQVLKLKTEQNYCAFTISKEPIKNLQDRKIVVGFLYKDLSFIKTQKCFFAASIYIKLLSQEATFSKKIIDYFLLQHKDKIIQNFYAALFFGKPVSKDLRQIISKLGISHIIALSGFHLSVIVGFLALIFFAIYPYFHKNYFPYRNKYRDFFVINFIFISSYLFLVGFIPSLIRAFFMSIFGYFLASKNIKIFSFEILLWTALILIAIFPKLLFSLGFYLSLVGVFYIFLFVKFIKMDNKILNLFYLSVFLYLAMSPFGFYFFKQASLYQLFSPLLSLLATFFLPLSIVLHIFKFGWILDPLLSVFFAIKQDLFYVEINNFTFITLLIFSFLATLKKEFFYAFIFCLIGFQIFIFTF